MKTQVCTWKEAPGLYAKLIKWHPKYILVIFQNQNNELYLLTNFKEEAKIYKVERKFHQMFKKSKIPTHWREVGGVCGQ